MSISPRKAWRRRAGAGRLLVRAGHSFDVAYTSLLKRAIRTLWLVLDEMDLMWIPVHRSWRLNERHYGALQGLDKAQTAAKFGDAQVLRWRRSYAIPPPALEPGDDRNPRRDPRYAALTDEELPLTECLRDTVERFLPFWHERLVPELRAGKRMLIAGHGNTLRALVKHLDGVSDEEIVGLNIPTGVPLLYRLDGDMNAVSPRVPRGIRTKFVVPWNRLRRRAGRIEYPTAEVHSDMSGETVASEEISFDDFLKVRVVTGTIVGVRVNPKARVPAFVIDIDFGPHGRRRSSAQLTGNYTPGFADRQADRCGDELSAEANRRGEVGGARSRSGVRHPRRRAAGADVSGRERREDRIDEARVWRPVAAARPWRTALPCESARMRGNPADSPRCVAGEIRRIFLLRRGRRQSRFAVVGGWYAAGPVSPTRSRSAPDRPARECRPHA